MKLWELVKPVSNKQLDDIMLVLSVTDNDQLFGFVEDHIDPNDETDDMTNEQVSNRESRLQAIQQALQETNDASLIDFIESRLKTQEIEQRIENIWNSRDFGGGRMIKYKDAFKDLIIQSPSSLKSKIQLLFYIARNNVAITRATFDESFVGTLDDLVPEKIKNNATYQAIKQTIYFNDAFRGKGIGPGEFALALFGKSGNIVDHQGDVFVDGIGIEIKAGEGGSIKTGSPNSFRRADELRSWIGKEVGIELDRKNKLKWEKQNDFTTTFMSMPLDKRESLASKYVKELYPQMHSDDQEYLATGIANLAGKEDVKLYFGKALLNSYKKQDQFDTILFVSKSGKVANISDVNDADIINFQLAGINRDGDTQALPDGYINGKLR